MRSLRSSSIESAGRPPRRRADQEAEQASHAYHAITGVLPSAGEAIRPQRGHGMSGRSGVSAGSMPNERATVVPRKIDNSEMNPRVRSGSRGGKRVDVGLAEILHRRHDRSMTAAERQHLTDIRHALLHLHKTLLDRERAAYERVHGRTPAG